MKLTHILTALMLVSTACTAQIKISELPTASNVADADKTIIVQGGVTKQATAALVRSGTTAAQISDATTVGRALMKLTTPGAITFLRVNADNTVTALSAGDFRTAIGAATAAQGALADTAVQPNRTITTGTGLSGGGDLSANLTLSLANTAVTAGTYGSSNATSSITIDQQGRITAASNSTITPGSIGAIPEYLVNKEALDPVWQKLWALTAASGEVALMTWGDSVSTGKWIYTVPEMQRRYGKRGSAMDALGVLSGVNSTTDFTKWPSRIWNLTQSGDLVEFTGFEFTPGSLNGSYVPIVCDELTVFYISENGTGNFAVDVANNGGSYSALSGWSNVATASGGNGTIGGFTKAAITRGSYTFKIKWVSGTVRIVGIRARDTLTGGVMFIQMGYSGQELSNMNSAPAAVVAPIMAELSPDCEMFEMKDGVSFSTSFPPHLAAQQAAVPDLTFLLVSSVVSEADPVGSQTASDELRSLAIANNLAFYDGMAAFGLASRLVEAGWYESSDTPGFGVHPTLAASAFVAQRMLAELGWLHVPPNRERDWRLWSNATNFEFDASKINSGGSMRLVNIPTSTSGYEIVRPDRTRRGIWYYLSDSHATNPGAYYLQAGDFGTIMMTTDGRVSLGYQVSASSDLTGIRLKLDDSGDFVMSGAVRMGTASAPSSLATGDIWGDSTQKLVRMVNSGLSTALAGTIFTQTADSTISNSVTQSSFTASGVGTTTLPANFFVAGKTVVMEASGYYSTNAVAPNITLLARLGGTNMGNSGAIALTGGLTNRGWRMRAEFTCRSVGASGTIQGQLTAWFGTNGAGQVITVPLTSATTFDTTGTLAIPVPRLTWSAAETDNSITMTNLTVRVEN